MLFEDPEVNITSPQSIIEPHKDSDCDWGRFIDSRGGIIMSPTRLSAPSCCLLQF